MPKVHYVGLKQDGETAFRELTNIERWMPGDAHELPQPVAARLLQHPDVFSLTKHATFAPAVPPAPPAPPQREKTVEQLELELAALESAGYEDADAAVADLRAHFGDLFTADDENEVRQVLGKASSTDTAPGTAGDAVQETATGSADTSGISLAPGGTVTAPAPAPTPAPTPAPAPAAAKKAAAKTSGKAKRK